MLRDIEYFATLASIHAKDYEYPKKDLDEMWENVLLYIPLTKTMMLTIDVNSMMYFLEAQLRWSTTMLARYISF